MEANSPLMVLADLIVHGIQPHAHVLRPILDRGQIAVVVHQLALSAEVAARILGWRPGHPVFALDEVLRPRLVAELEPTDAVAARWLSEPRDGGRIFALVGAGTLLVNCSPGNRYSLEPRSLDEHRARA